MMSEIRGALPSFILTFPASYTGRWSIVPPPRTGAQLRSSVQPTAGAWWPVRPGGHRISAQQTQQAARSVAPKPQDEAK